MNTVAQFRSISMLTGFCRHLVTLSVTLMSLKHADHLDVFVKYLIKFYLNNMVNLQQLTPHAMPRYTHKMAIV